MHAMVKRLLLDYLYHWLLLVRLRDVSCWADELYRWWRLLNWCM